MNIKTVIFASIVGGLTIGPIQAQAGGSNGDHRQYKNGHRASQSYQEYARVVHVEPQYRSVRVEVPREQCWEERVAERGHGYRNGGHGGRKHAESYTPHILGAVVGAAVGRKFGRGRGQDAATVAGAVLGGSIGRDVHRRHRSGNRHGHNNRRHGSRYQIVERCETVNDYRNEERVDGYRVEYEYEGRRYWTTTDYDPGNEIAINVTVRPQRK